MGLAVGDDTTGVTSPLEIVPYEGVERAAQQIAALASKVGAARVVLGLPTLEDGSRGPASRRNVQTDLLKPLKASASRLRCRASSFPRTKRGGERAQQAAVLVSLWMTSRPRCSSRSTSPPVPRRRPRRAEGHPR